MLSDKERLPRKIPRAVPFPLPADKDLRLYYPVESDVKVARDRSGWRNDGTLYNGVSLARIKHGYAFDFVRSSNQYIEVPAHSSVRPSNALTMIAWVKRSGAGVMDTVFSSGYVFSSYGVKLVFTPANVLQLAVVRSGPSDQSISSAGAVTDSNWHFIAGVWNGSQLYVFLDGAKSAPAPCTSVIYNSAGKFYVGCREAGQQHYDGQIKNCLFYGRALTDAEIASHYAEFLNM